MIVKEFISLSLKTNNEQELIDALPFARGVNEEDVAIWITSSHEYNLNIIGDLYGDATVLDGVVTVEPVKLFGYHANIKCTQEIADLILESITVSPNNPKIVWF